MRYAVFITSGIGNAVFLIPLIKELKKTGTVTAISTSTFDSELVFDGFKDSLFEETIQMKRSIPTLKLLSKAFNQYDEVFIDYFGATRKNILLASLISKKVITSKIPVNLHDFLKRKLNLILPRPGLNEGIQNLRYKKLDALDELLSEEMYALNPRKFEREIANPYITIQPGAGNNKTQWKIWPYQFWLEMIKKVVIDHPNIHVLVLGDENDEWMKSGFASIGDRVLILFNKTKIESLPGLLKESLLHIGGDSGLLHIAGVVGIPTLTICGGSDEDLFGWHKINSEKHHLIQKKLDCHPCYRWFLPNKTRVKNADDCPDFKCIRSITPDEVYLKVNAILSH